MARPVIKVDINRKAFERVRTCAEALLISEGDLKGPVLTRLAQKHRRQMKEVFSSEGRVGASGQWEVLNPGYAVRKRKKWGRRRILVASGDMKERFTATSRTENIERFVASGPGRGTYQFGARSKIAVAHFKGFSGFRTSTLGKRFRYRLPRRDMVTKTAVQILALREELVAWYVGERIPQVARVCRAEAAKAAQDMRKTILKNKLAVA